MKQARNNKEGASLTRRIGFTKLHAAQRVPACTAAARIAPWQATSSTRTQTRISMGAQWNAKHKEAAANAKGRTFGKLDRKSTRLNSSHVKISYAVFCLKKKKQH